MYTQHTFMQKRFYTPKRGFTLIETLVAVVILVSAVVGPLLIASKGFSAALIARDQVAAFYLAQDAVEYVRYKRDTNKLGGSLWLAGLNNCISSDASVACQIDSIQDTVTACSGGVCGALQFDTTTGYFNYNAVSATNPKSLYTRTITITNPAGTNANSDEALLVVTVSWKDVGGVTRMVRVREDLFNWQ